jgi:heme-degrading monooxygenase HmoA
MIAIMWQFEVKAGREAEFEELYGVDGEWTALNRHTRSYLGTSFLHDQNRSSRYIVVEYWSEMVVYEEHRVFRSDEIALLEERSRVLVDAVEPLGIFTPLDVPDRFGPTWSKRK